MGLQLTRKARSANEYAIKSGFSELWLSYVEPLGCGLPEPFSSPQMLDPVAVSAKA